MLSYRGGRLFLEDVPAAALARRFQTPLYAYSKKTLLSQVRAVREAFRAVDPLLCYAMKANSNRRICGLLAGEGLGAEVVSGGELRRALAAGFERGRIVFSGVGKTEGELRLAIRSGIMAVNVESEAELERLEKIARRMRRRARIAIRVNPDVDAGTHAHVTTGTSKDKFGVDRRRALALYRRAARSPHLLIRGIHCHIGSQVTRIGPYKKAALIVAGIARELARSGIRLDFIDLGGGMGVVDEAGRALDLKALAQEMKAAISEWPQARLVLEPGRFLTAASGVLLTRALLRKKTMKRDFIVVDAGMNDLIRPALYGARHPIWPERRRRGGAAGAVDVVGPVCESADFLAKGIRLAGCRQGDILAVLHAGAYGFSMSSQYNSRPRAAEVLVDGRRARLIRRRETLGDLVRCER